MTANLNSREELLAAVHSLRNEVERVFAAVQADTRPSPGDPQTWSGKDILAHLTSWRLTTAARLEAGLRGTEPMFPWPAELDEDRDLDAINQWFVTSSRERPLAEIANESTETFDRIERALAALPEADLLTPDRFPWLAGYALGPEVIRGTLDHHEEHAGDLQPWLDTTPK